MLTKNVVIAVLALLLVVFGTVYMVGTVSNKMGEQEIRIIVVPKTNEQNMEFWRVVIAGVRAASKEFDVNVEIKGPKTETDIAEQIRILEDAVKERPKAIVMAATDYDMLVPVAQKIKNAGIPLITIDSDINSDLPESFIATNNIEAGKKAGQAIVDRVDTRAKVAIVSFVKGSATQIEREKGVRQGISPYRNIQIVGTYFSNGIEKKAYEITKELLNKHPDLNGIVGLNEISTLGVARAIKEMGLSGRVKVVGFDNSINEIKFIEEGIIQATIVQKPFNMGYLGVKTALQVIKKERINRRIDTGSQMITKENMYSYENQKLLFPFVER